MKREMDDESCDSKKIKKDDVLPTGKYESETVLLSKDNSSKKNVKFNLS